MIFIKFCGAVIIVVSGTLCGIYAAKSVENRVKFLEQYVMFLTQVKTMICYGAISVSEILKSVNAVPLVSPLLDECGISMSDGMSFEAAWHKAVNKEYKKKLFTAEDKMLLCSFGETFGNSDADGETTKTELHIALVSERLNKIREEHLSKNKLYRIVGMFSGIAIALIII